MSLTDCQVTAVIFDLDGLMVDSERLFFIVGTRLLERRGKQFSEKTMSQMLGRRADEGFAFMIEEYNLHESWESLAEESRELLYELMPKHLRIMPGLASLLDYLGDGQLLKAVATSSMRSYTERVLNQFDLRHVFNFLITAEDVTRGKPHPEIYQVAIRRLGRSTSEVLVLEDSPAGLAAAKAAGAMCIVVPSPYADDADWSAADAIVDRLDAPEVFDVLGGSR